LDSDIVFLMYSKIKVLAYWSMMEIIMLSVMISQKFIKRMSVMRK
jgi:hypothetical protein